MLRMTCRAVSAFCIAHTSPSTSRVTCLPSSAPQPCHSADYYEDSAAVGLAPRRPSRIPSRATSECAVGAPFGSLSRLIACRPACGSLGSHLLNDLVTMAPRQAWSSTNDRFHPWSLGFRQSSFHPSTRVWQSRTLHAFRAAPLRQHAAVPVGFRREVSC